MIKCLYCDNEMKIDHKFMFEECGYDEDGEVYCYVCYNKECDCVMSFYIPYTSHNKEVNVYECKEVK